MPDRGQIGTTPVPTEKDDEAYLDFVEGAKLYHSKQISPSGRSQANAALQHAARSGLPLDDLETILSIVNAQPQMQMSNRFNRTTQEMLWNETIDTLRKREPELIAALDQADRSGPGSVQWDPNFRYPSYFDPVDFHIQPGSYHADPLAGYIYHVGTKYFLQGSNNNDELQRMIVNAVPAPADGQVRRIVDLACSCGQSTTAFKERFPQAEVWGIDIAAPMVRYSHLRAINMGLDVHFKQALAEETGFPAGSFDVVFSNILFHELPENISDQVMREAYRLLRPGGVWAFVDIKDHTHMTPEELPLARYSHDWQAKYQGEPYHPVFHAADFAGMMRRAGFREVHNDFSGVGWTGGASFPMRVAFK